MRTVIRVDNVSKQYRLGEISTGTLAHDINRWWHRLRGNEDPYVKIGELNDRTLANGFEYIWALKNVSFDVKQGEVLGIIGRNGAGKSTLLKILSRTTTPTFGEIRIKGRVASLLEVGTGFHPELSGRNNIFLNGAIMGMSRTEIKKKFDEIVDFAGVEKYIDTPVKRYSSGMYVRLAFAVAAHLEPEILVVDEVLAVGDAEFQKKCLGKMKEVSNSEGRTVLFVSHNMTAVKSLCDSCIWIEQGLVKDRGDSDRMVDKYLTVYMKTTNQRQIDCSKSPQFRNGQIKFTNVAIENVGDVIRVDDPITIYFRFECLTSEVDLNMSLVLYNREDICILNTGSQQVKGTHGIFEARCYIPANFLNDEFYRVRILVVQNSSTALIDIDNIITFQVEDIERQGSWYGKWIGVVRPEFKWDFEKKVQP